MRVLILNLVLIFFLVGTKAIAQEPEEYTLKITLVNGATKGLIKSAIISIDSLGIRLNAQGGGIYDLKLPKGNHVIEITSSGYQKLVQPVTVLDDGQFKLKMYRLVEKKSPIMVGRYPIKMSFDNTEKRKGPVFGFGAGTGYSNHAASYTYRESAGVFKKRGGYRMFTINLEAGYAFSPKFILNYNFKYSPPNTTISPYNSTYHGGEINVSPARWGRGLIVLGGGYQAVSDKQGFLAEGFLINAGIGYEISKHFVFEMINVAGFLESNVNADREVRFLDSTEEFAVIFSVNYLFY